MCTFLGFLPLLYAYTLSGCGCFCVPLIAFTYKLSQNEGRIAGAVLITMLPALRAVTSGQLLILAHSKGCIWKLSPFPLSSHPSVHINEIHSCITQTAKTSNPEPQTLVIPPPKTMNTQPHNGLSSSYACYTPHNAWYTLPTKHWPQFKCNTQQCSKSNSGRARVPYIVISNMHTICLGYFDPLKAFRMTNKSNVRKTYVMC